jgi:hypothetical protein
MRLTSSGAFRAGVQLIWGLDDGHYIGYASLHCSQHPYHQSAIRNTEFSRTAWKLLRASEKYAVRSVKPLIPAQGVSRGQ